MERRSLAASLFVYGAAMLMSLVILAPMVWLFLMSISSSADLSAHPLHWWPRHVDLSRYRTLVSLATNSAGAAFLAALRNSLFVSGLATLGAILIAVPAGWAVSRTPKVHGRSMR